MSLFRVFVLYLNLIKINFAMDNKEVKTKADVEKFLVQFFPKMDVWGIIFLDREKNIDALAALGITPRERERHIRAITGEDYVETVISALAFGEMWVFGKDMNGRELYIKLSLGAPGSQTVCISFHEAEKKIDYAFKKEDK